MQSQPTPTSSESTAQPVEAHAQPIEAQPQPESGLLDLLLRYGTEDSRSTANATVDEFLAADSLAGKLQAYLGRLPQPDEFESTKRRVARDISRIDDLLATQVNAIIHHTRYQDLESAWRGLWHTVERSEIGRETIEEQGGSSTIQIRVWNVSKRDLLRDFDRASEFDQSNMFRKVYEEEFGMAGGTPYGALIGNYSFTNHPDDIELLGHMSGVAAAAFAPLITDAGPDLLGLDDFSVLEQPLNLPATFAQKSYARWNSLRERPDSQFLALTLPRILMRKPYTDNGGTTAGFRFSEDVQGPDQSKYLWGSSAWAFASVIIRAYASTGWFGDIRGVKRGSAEGGLVNGFPAHSFGTDRDGVAIKSSTEIALSDTDERALCQLGFIPLSDCQDTEYSVFYSNQSVHSPEDYDDPVATANARISAMMQYVLCCSRFAHYIKLQARMKIGTTKDPYEIQDWLNSWIVDYVTADDRANPDMKARYPLREAECTVDRVPAEPGAYRLTMNLRPHYQLDQLAASVRLVSRISPPS